MIYLCRAIAWLAGLLALFLILVVHVIDPDVLLFLPRIAVGGSLIPVALSCWFMAHVADRLDETVDLLEDLKDGQAGRPDFSNLPK